MLIKNISFIFGLAASVILLMKCIFGDGDLLTFACGAFMGAWAESVYVLIQVVKYRAKGNQK